MASPKVVFGSRGTPDCQLCKEFEKMAHEDPACVSQKIAKWNAHPPCILLHDYVQGPLGAHLFVSTTFLHVDHSFGSGEPLWYETMVFDAEKNHHGFISSSDHLQVRYETCEEAEKGHKNVLRKLAKGVKPKGWYR